MQTIGFIGAYDKTDLILYLAKILTTLNYKVLMVDSTITQKTRYIVPSINPTQKYITEFEKIDVAVGFDSFIDIKNYIGLNDVVPLEYDIALVDIDSADNLAKFNAINNEKNYFVTGFDVYSLKRGLEALSELKEPIKLTKILFSKEMLKEENEYLDFLALGYKIEWEELKLCFPLEIGDKSVIMENQIIARIKLKNLSEQYKEGLAYLIENITKQSIQNIRKAFKTIEKEG